MAKIKIYNIDGKYGKEIEVPEYFSQKIREDVVSKVLETKKSTQPYAPNALAGRFSASGKLQHRRHIWKSQYGRGISRIPRKIMSRKGSQFNWVGATVPNTRGGRRAHPPKVISMINTKKINKKEYLLAMISALSATANANSIIKKYSRLEDKKIEKHLPIIIESKISGLKTKLLQESIKNILGETLYNVAISKKSIRAGKGKTRGRKHKKTAGMLLVLGKDENLKTNLFEVVKAKELGVTDLASGGVGRLTMYTEKAISDLNQRINGEQKK